MSYILCFCMHCLGVQTRVIYENLGVIATGVLQVITRLAGGCRRKNSCNWQLRRTELFTGLKGVKLSRLQHDSRGNIPIFRKSSHTMFSSYSRPGFWYVTLIGISAQSGGNSWPTANPLNAPPQLSIPYVVPKQLWTLNELKAALIRKFPHLSTEEGQGCQR